MTQHGIASAGTARQQTCPACIPLHSPRTAEQTAWTVPRIPTAAFPHSLCSVALPDRRSGTRQRPSPRGMPKPYFLSPTLRLPFPAPTPLPLLAVAQSGTGARTLPSQSWDTCR